MTKGQQVIRDWFKAKKWKQFPFQLEMEEAYLNGYSGLLNAPTGSGKTFGLFLPFLEGYINKYPDAYQKRTNNGLRMLWITPLRALTNDIRKAMQEVCDELDIPWVIGTRTGDTPLAEKQALKRKLPEVLLTTPESLHLMLAQKDYPKIFQNLEVVVIDEWHELLGTKRGVQVELGLSKIRKLAGLIRDLTSPSALSKGEGAEVSISNNPFFANNPQLTTHNSQLKIWGISATIGNLEQAAEVLLGNSFPPEQIRMVRANIEKNIVIKSVIPQNIESYSWTGHIGLALLPEVMDIVAKSNTTLIFTNTRSQSEIWYHAILDNYPEYAGIMAMHHGSLDNELRNWVEQALHAQALKLVVCTSSLDLGVDFRPVDTVIQVGSPKGVARFMQRAGRSGHHPGATSRVWFIPTHSLELLEGAALKQAMINGNFESRDPILLAMDVLIQYMVTLAVSDGFRANELFEEIKSTYAFADLRREEFGQLLDFITTGGSTLSQYDEFLKVEVENGVYKVNNRRVAMRHRLSIGTITSEVSLRVKLLHGGSLGNIEEYFISKLKPGDTFWFAGRSLEFVNVKEMTANVKKSNAKKGLIPSWLGGRMPLSSQLAAVFRDKLDEVARGIEKDEEVIALKPLFDLQSQLSVLPQSHQFLIESFKSREGHHLLFYPFEGRLVHEGMASLFAYRISKIKPATFSIAMNDYGFELLTDDDVWLQEALEQDLFTIHNLLEDIQHSLNANEMARRRFRDIAHIGGLVFTGYPGQPVKNRHLQASTSLLFDVFSEYEPNNLLVRQAYNEALAFQLEEFRLRIALQRISKQDVVVKEIERPTPFAFPIMVDSLREKLTTESLEDRVTKMARDYDVEVTPRKKNKAEEERPEEPKRHGFTAPRGYTLRTRSIKKKG
ncbi:ligase-associated DNA damage response DEXH box helicase [Mucilaginibacter ginkgonis]|uniref:Ligase-associated DNA damage response DEXH box helicase n=1 Tax=Mucilaginibacter ginkgonis TaxID=2682091 RepID=A0A6I4INH5_9SPHI|nr:ligase-associated DNA damage response DEXH box helicase [Mucilaginibacter ginkgonis]QQL49556.1 ligase-associated DNA damage response DEXH box helicase [Mucilaginibacter ginkgonis]